MCVNTKIQKLQQQKQEIDAKIAKLEQFDRASSVIRGLLQNLIVDYRSIAPDELNDFLGELAMTLNANDESDIKKPEFAAITSDDEDEQPTKIAIALTEQYREPNEPPDPEAMEAIKISVCNDEDYLPPTDYGTGFSENDPQIKAEAVIMRNLYKWGFSLIGRWEDEEFVWANDIVPYTENPLQEEDLFTAGEYERWNIYFTIPNGGVVGIQLKSPTNHLYDRSTELDEEWGFPKDLSLCETEKILEWVKKVIDSISGSGTLPLILSPVIDPRIELFSGSLILESFNLTVKMSPATHKNENGDLQLSGVTFKFLSERGEFEVVATAEEIDDQQPMYMALMLAIRHQKNQAQKSASNVSAPKPDEFTEFVKLSKAVGYLKRRDNGEILSGYLGFSNKTPEGDRAPTMAKSRAAKWAEWLIGTFQMHCSEPRQPKRIISDNPKQPFTYEIKLSKPSIGHLQKLAEQDFNLLPNEEAEDLLMSSQKPQPATKNSKTFSIAVNGYTFRTSKDELAIKESFEEEILKLSPNRLTVEFYEGATRLERWNFHDLSFTSCADFDEANPEYNVFYAGFGANGIKVWSSLRSTAGKTERIWRHNLLKPGEEIFLLTREAAAVHAIRRQQQQTESPQI